MIRLFNVILLLLIYNVFPKFKEKLKFINQEFTILQLTDLHYGEDQFLDDKTSEVQDKLLKFLKPNLVVITGDSVGGWNWNHSTGWYKDQWEKFTSVFKKYEIPYAFTLGNHDPEADLSSSQIIELDQIHPYSLMKQFGQENNGTSNYLLHLYSSINETKISSTLWLFDSMSRTCEGMYNTYGCVTRKQVLWYNHESTKLMNLSYYNPHGIAFMHIPLPAIRNVYNNADLRGTKKEAISCPRLDTCLFNNITFFNNIQSVFFGHDHDNDFGGVYRNILLKYGRKTGYGNYGPKGRQHGGTVLKLKENVNENGGINVTLDYYILNEDLTLDYQLPSKKREGDKEFECVYDDGLSISNNSDCGDVEKDEIQEKNTKKVKSYLFLIISSIISFSIVCLIFIGKYLLRKRKRRYFNIESNDENTDENHNTVTI